MNDLYDLAARVSLDVGGLSSAASIAMQVFSRLHAQAGSTTAQVDKLSRAFKLFATGAVITGVGAGLLGFMDKAVQRAMALQTIMVGIQQRTHTALIDPRTQAFTAQGSRLQDLFTRIGLTNQMSTTDVAGVAQAASQAGITGLSQLTSMLKPLANYSEVMLRATGASTAGSAKTATEFAHLFGAFGTKTIGGVSDTQYMVNQLGKAMQVVPVSQEQFLQMVSNYAGTVRPMYRGKPPGQFISDTIDYGVLLAQMGQNTQGGSRMARLLVQAMGAGSRTSKIGMADLATIQRVSGVSFTNKQGQITDPVSLMKALTGFATHPGVTPRVELQFFQQAFKQAGTSLAGLFADPVVAQRFKSIAATMKAMPDLSAQQRAYNASPAGQFNQARANFDSAMTALGLLWLPIATRAANALASFTAGIVRLTQQHPKIMQFLATFIALSAAVALVVGPLLMLAGVVALLQLVTLPALVAAMLPVILIFAGLVAAIALVTAVIMNWSKIFGPSADPGGTAAALTPGNAPPPGAKHGHWAILGAGKSGQIKQWVEDPPTPPAASGRRDAHGRPVGGGGYVEHHYHFAPGAIAPVVHAAPHHDEEHLAQRVAAVTLRELGDGLQAALNGGATTVFGMSPSLHVMA